MENLKLYDKMYKVMNESEAIEKAMTVGSGKNSYRAVSEASMLNLIKPLFRKYKLIIFPIDGDIKDNTLVWEKTDNYKGTVANNLRAITELKVKYKIVDTESGESELLIGFGNGADSQDKGAGKASTYSYKNCLSKTFMLFSGEDTDSVHSDDIGKDNRKQVMNKVSELNTKDIEGATISKEQQNALFAIAGSNVLVAKKVLLLHKYTSSEMILKSEYQTICKEIEKAL